MCLNRIGRCPQYASLARRHAHAATLQLTLHTAQAMVTAEVLAGMGQETRWRHG